MTKNELRKMVKEILNLETIPPLLESQIHRFRMELGLTYKEIARALVYFFDVQKNEYKPAFGVGVLPSIVPEANKYYDKLRKQREEQIKSVEAAKEHSNIILEVKHIPLKRKTRKIDIESLVINDDD